MGAVTSAARAVSRGSSTPRVLERTNTPRVLCRATSLTALAGAVFLSLFSASMARANPPVAPPQPPPRDSGSHSTDGPLSAVSERVRSRDFDGALAALDALSSQLNQRPALRYLRARLYEKKERLRDALDTLPEDLTGLPALVVRDIQIRRALWYARMGRCNEARPMLIALSKYDGPDAELTLRAADCALLQADAASALVLLRDVRGAGSKRFAVRFTLAKVMASTGDNAGALRELRSLYVEYPDNSRIGEVEAQLRELVPDWQPSNDDHFARAEHWLDAGQPEAALAELELLHLPKPHTARERAERQTTLGHIAHVKGMALFRTRTRYAEAARVLNQAATLGSPTRSSDAYHAARALARADRDADAVRAYREFAKRYPKDPLAADAVHDAAWLELRHDLPGGETHMKALLRDAERSGSKHAQGEALWDLAIHAFTKRHCDRALAWFERYAATSESPPIKARGLYWAGRCAALLGKRDLALQHYRAALSVEPLNWYALLAQAQITAQGGQPGPPFAGSDAEAGDHVEARPNLDALHLPPAAAFYAELGLVSDAVNALRQDETSLREGREDDGLPLLVAAYHTLGEYTRPYHLAERERADVLLRQPTPSALPIWDALFPKPYMQEVNVAANAAAIPVELVYAVMRQESGYNPNVVSGANAIGLMQLIERTARSNAHELAIANFERSMLYEPATNVLLGSHYLAKLITRYRGHAVPAVAAYNAGEHQVDPWLKRAAKPDKTVDIDWFVEDIPIDQTRNYVKRVVCNWARYRYLEHPSGWPLELALSLKL
jgi:soluble lytic murein transglycosylase